MASIKISEKQKHLKSIKHSDYANISLKEGKKTSTIKEVLPFRIKFVNVQIPGYGPNNVPPIGIAIIGINNYIL